jgi:hypothetical protein
VFSSDVSVQTETVAITFHSPTRIDHELNHIDDQESALTAADLAAILKWSKDISSDINLSAGIPSPLSSLLKLNFLLQHSKGWQRLQLVRFFQYFGPTI